MSFKNYIDITPEIEAAIRENRPVVALESTILSHGMPYPENVEFAAEVEKIVRAEGAVPATMALINGRIKVGLTAEELEIMCRAENIGKVSRRDFATYLATKQNGATTVATTMMCCEMAGIKVFATGGIGGVHRNGENTMDVSADLQELANTPVAVVCAGAKQILDIGRTLEYLETMGVPVLGNGTEDFPAFYCKKSGFGVDYAAKDEKEIANIIFTKWDLGLKGGALIGNPIPDEWALDFDYMEGIINDALKEADEKGVRGKHITPFLLARVKEMTKGVSFASNKQLAYNNARCAAKVARELCELSK
ncbi:MAG: pseudouridine-5'-phosphate glycosidase [Clostridia bacterium]|nr:pseudouridine-5'-phosphate glycosidase [Clostridia bacterium]